MPEQQERGACGEYETDQRQRHKHVHFTQQLDAALNATGYREIGDDRHDADEPHHIKRRVRHPIQPGDTGHGLLRTQPERGGQAKQRGEHRQDVDGIAGAAPDCATEQRVESRTNRQRHLEVVAENGETKAYHRIHGPGVQGPVKQGSRHGQVAGAGNIARRSTQWCCHRRLGAQRVVEMRDGFCHPVEHQAHAHAGTKQHREPSK